MPMNAVYRGPRRPAADDPGVSAAGRALVAARGRCRSTSSSPRYLAMVDDSLRDGHRLIGMIQPDTGRPGPDQKPNLYKVGCRRPHDPDRREPATARYLIQLIGRRPLPGSRRELNVATAYRQCQVQPIRPSSTISSPARARRAVRPQGAARPPSQGLPQGPTSCRPTGRESRKRGRTRRLGQRR